MEPEVSVFENGYSSGVPSSKQKMYVWLMFAVVIFMTSLAVVIGVSDFLIKKSEYSIDSWESLGKIKSEPEYREVINQLKLAQRLNPINAVTIYNIARAYEWKALQYPLWTEQARRFRYKAMEQYHRVLSLRPTWSLAWVMLAQNKFLTQKIDEELWHALEMAIKYGAFEYEVQRKLIWLGIATYGLQPEYLKAPLGRVIEAGLQDDYLSDYVMKTAIRYQWADNIISFLNVSKLARLRVLENRFK